MADTEKPTTAAPDSTTLGAETAVVPDDPKTDPSLASKPEKATTAAPDNTTLGAETAVVPDDPKADPSLASKPVCSTFTNGRI